MPRVRTEERNQNLKRFCIENFRYDNGDLYYREGSYLGTRPNSKRYMYTPIPISTQVMKTPTGSTYNYAVQSVYINGVRSNIMRSRLVWLLVYGDWPKGNVLHIDGNQRNCYHKNLVEVNPRMMHIYTRLVNNLDKNKIASSISRKRNMSKGKKGRCVSCPVVEFKKDDVIFDFKAVFLSRNIPTTTFVDTVYNGHMNYIVSTMKYKLEGINLELYHQNKTRHKKIMKEYRNRYGDYE